MNARHLNVVFVTRSQAESQEAGQLSVDYPSAVLRSPGLGPLLEIVKNLTIHSCGISRGIRRKTIRSVIEMS